LALWSPNLAVIIGGIVPTPIELKSAGKPPGAQDDHPTNMVAKTMNA
jgi:hypothetical protein